MNKKNGFSLIELAVTLAIVGILSAVSFYGYHRTMDKAITTDALSSLNAIRLAEQTRKIDNKSFIAANNTSEINQILELRIQPKYYEYRVANVTDDDFIVIAERIGADIDGQNGLSNRIVIAMNGGGELKSGPLTSGGNGGGGLIVTGGSNPGSVGGGNIPGVPGTGVITGGGGSSGGGGGGGSGGLASRDRKTSANLEAAVELLKGVDDEAYNLIKEKNILIVFEDMPEGTGAYWMGIGDNTIHINSGYQSGSSNQAIAALIAHEATHADYSYNPAKWIAFTLAEHSGLVLADIHIAVDTIDQEYNCYEQQVLTWKRIKDARRDQNNDGWAAYYDQGEAEMKAEIRLRYTDRFYPEY